MPSQFAKRKVKDKKKDDRPLTHKAFDIFIGTDKKYNVVMIGFNPETGDSQIELVESGVDRQVAMIFMSKKEALKKLLKLQGE